MLPPFPIVPRRGGLRTAFLWGFVCLAIIAAAAQRDTLIMTHLKPLDPDRYANIKGSPYQFEDWVLGDITRPDQVVIKDAPLRYNGYLQAFEVRREDQYMVLAEHSCVAVSIDPRKNSHVPAMADYQVPIVFRRGFHPQYQKRYAQVIFEAGDLMLICDFSKKIETKTFESPGKTVETERFFTRRSYAICRAGELTRVKLKTKSFAQVLGYPKELSRFLKERKLRSIQGEADARTVMEFYSTLLP